ncbi:MAG: hypothetical protein JW774_07900 [Candidatus Aureabacteria bacterium]|nr:hypothetical protein [Candidatus Auribacterota bacterium]
MKNWFYEIMAEETLESRPFFLNPFKQVLILLLLGAVLFFPAYTGEWVWDDFSLIVLNKNVTDFSLNSLKSLLSHEYFYLPDYPACPGNVGYYRPLANVTYALLYQVFGNKPFLFHLYGLFLHLMITLLLVRIGFQITSSGFISFLSGVVFFIHPVHHQAVYYITGIVDLQAVLFGLFSFFLLQAYLAQPLKSKWKLGWSCILYGCSIYTKEIAFLLPMIPFIFHSVRYKNVRRKKWHILLLYLPVPLSLFWIRKYILHLDWLPDGVLFHFLTYYGTIIQAFFRNIFQTIFPFRLWYFKSYIPLISNVSAWLWVGLFCGFFLLFIRLRKNQVLTYAGIWFGLFYLPVSNFLPLAPCVAEKQIYSPEHLLYLPSFGVYLLLIYAVVKGSQGNMLKQILPRLLLIYLAWTAIQSFKTASLWHDSERLHLYQIQQTPLRLDPYQGLGYYYMIRGEYEKAQCYLNQGLSLPFEEKDKYFKTLTNMAQTQLVLGEVEKARQNLETVLSFWPENYFALYLLGNIYLMRHQEEQAVHCFNEIKKIKPDFMSRQKNK